MNEIIEKQNAELKNVIFKAPALITLFVVSELSDGKISPSELRSSKIYLSILSNQADDAFRDYFQKVKETYEEDLKTLDGELPKDLNKRKEKIEEMLEPVKKFIAQLPPSTGIPFKDALLGFITHAHDAREDTLESVLLPFVSDELQKIENQRLRKILD